MYAVGYSRDAKGRFVDYHINEVVGAIHTWEQTGNTQKRIMVIHDEEDGMDNDSAPHGIRQEGPQGLRSAPGSLQRKQVSVLVPRLDGISGTITTVTKDNLILIIV